MREHRMFGSESHVHQGRPRHRQVQFGRPRHRSLTLCWPYPPTETRDLRSVRPHQHRSQGHRAGGGCLHPSSRGGCTWPGPLPVAPSSTTSSRGCCRRWDCARPSSTGTPATSAHQDFYLDIAEITADGQTWQTVDLYLDLVVHTGDAHRAARRRRAAGSPCTMGLVTPETAERAIHDGGVNHRRAGPARSRPADVAGQ